MSIEQIWNRLESAVEYADGQPHHIRIEVVDRRCFLVRVDHWAERVTFAEVEQGVGNALVFKIAHMVGQLTPVAS